MSNTLTFSDKWEVVLYADRAFGKNDQACRNAACRMLHAACRVLHAALHAAYCIASADCVHAACALHVQTVCMLHVHRVY